jgi:hypothetical protein
MKKSHLLAERLGSSYGGKEASSELTFKHSGSKTGAASRIRQRGCFSR